MIEISNVLADECLALHDEGNRVLEVRAQREAIREMKRAMRRDWDPVY